MASNDKSQAFVVEPGIQAGTTLKTSPGTLKIPFLKPFTGNPVVVVTPYWALQSGGVGTIETVVAVTSEDFTVSSQNAASSHYYINWAAYGNF